MIENFKKLARRQDFHPLKRIAGFEIMREITGHQELDLRFHCADASEENPEQLRVFF